MVRNGRALGVVGGQRIPPVIRYEVGFVAGVKSVNPDAEVIIVYTDTFGDPDLGKQTAAAGPMVVGPHARAQAIKDCIIPPHGIRKWTKGY
jgi:hypothetical protein